MNLIPGTYISSVRVPRSMYIVMYSSDGFIGNSTSLNDRTYDNPETGFLCKTIELKDRNVNSLEVFKIAKPGDPGKV